MIAYEVKLGCEAGALLPGTSEYGQPALRQLVRQEKAGSAGRTFSICSIPLDLEKFNSPKVIF